MAERHFRGLGGQGALRGRKGRDRWGKGSGIMRKAMDLDISSRESPNYR